MSSSSAEGQTSQGHRNRRVRLASVRHIAEHMVGLDELALLRDPEGEWGQAGLGATAAVVSFGGGDGGRLACSFPEVGAE